MRKSLSLSSNLQPSSPAKLEEVYRQSRPLYQTCLANGFEALDLRNEQKVLLWRLRASLQPMSRASTRTLAQQGELTKLRFSSPKIFEFGADRNGIVFLACELLRGVPIVDRTIPMEIIPDIYYQAAELLAHIHGNNLLLGTISEGTFIADRQKEVYLACPMTSNPDLEHILFPEIPDNLRSYISPEQRAGSLATPASDMFSLGACLYRTAFQKEFPVFDDEQEHANYLNTYMPSLVKSEAESYPWLSPILQKLLAWKSEQRYQNGKELVNAFEDEAIVGKLADSFKEDLAQDALSWLDAHLSSSSRISILIGSIVFFLLLIFVGRGSIFYAGHSGPESTSENAKGFSAFGNSILAAPKVPNQYWSRDNLRKAFAAVEGKSNSNPTAYVEMKVRPAFATKDASEDDDFGDSLEEPTYDSLINEEVYLLVDQIIRSENDLRQKRRLGRVVRAKDRRGRSKILGIGYHDPLRLESRIISPHYQEWRIEGRFPILIKELITPFVDDSPSYCAY